MNIFNPFLMFNLTSDNLLGIVIHQSNFTFFRENIASRSISNSHTIF